MLSNFKRDLEAAKGAEMLVRETFASLTFDYTFKDVSDIRDFYYKGDIRAFNITTGTEVFIEVKHDTCIYKTENVLCEEEVFYKELGYFGKGNMSCDCDVYVVVSDELRKMFVIDFKVLKSIYKKGEFKAIDHPEQTTYCYLCPIWLIKKYNGIISIIDF